MTAANNGASTPEDDDPFGYLYADGQAAAPSRPARAAATATRVPAAQPGVPRTSYNQVRTVGERQYGQQVPQQQAYGQQQGSPASRTRTTRPPRPTPAAPPPARSRAGHGTAATAAAAAAAPTPRAC